MVDISTLIKILNKKISVVLFTKVLRIVKIGPVGIWV